MKIKEKYYIKMTDSRFYPVRVYYKKYKCSYGWNSHKEGCWKFSKYGAVKIVGKLNETALQGITYELEGAGIDKD